MPLPKRPFTTTSLTSTLRSTIASQPLLSNLNNNIDKLSSQATSFAQKSPFFNAINPQQQQANQQQQQPQQTQQQQPQHAAIPPSGGARSSIDSGRVATDQQQQQQQQSMMYRPTAAQMQTGPKSNVAAARQMPDASPAVDMSHLTEEERMMIQSVMAKAEMADMGMPVDTSVPSSTNLPSSASNALVQQQQQARANQRQPVSHQQQQQQQQFPMMDQNQRQQQHRVQDQFSQQQMNMMQGGNSSSNNNNEYQQMNSSAISQQPTFNSAQQFQQQQQQQLQLQQQQAFPQNMQQLQPVQSQPQQQMLNQQQVSGSQMVPQSSQATPHPLDPMRVNPIPTLEQQTQQLISQINSQFNLGGQQHEQQTNQPANSMQLYPAPTGQFGANNRQQQLQQQQQQPQLQQANNNQFQQPHQLGQQQSNIPGSFDQQTSMSTNAFNPEQLQVQPTSGHMDISQQQQYPIDQRQAQMLQMDQNDYGINNQSIINASAGQVTDSMNTAQQQQQQFLANMNKPLVNNSNNNCSMNQPLQRAITLMNSQTNNNSFDANSLPNFVSHHHQAQEPALLVNQRADRQVPDFSAPVNRQFMNRNLADPMQVQASGSYGPNTESQIQAFGQTSFYHQDPRANNNIRFGQQLQQQQQQLGQVLDSDYKDHTLSDQEYQGGRSRRHRGFGRYESTDMNDQATTRRGRRDDEIDSHERNLLAYDLAQKTQRPSSAASRHSPARQLPQVSNQQPDQYSATVKQPDRRQHHHQQQQSNRSKKAKRSYGKSSLSSNRGEVTGESPENLSERSDELDSPPVEIEPIKRAAAAATTTTTKDVAQLKKSPVSPAEKEDVASDKNEGAMRLLAELKLTEQANQMMEQQQLLIKQSQELIRLQLEQQALSQEVKKSIKHVEPAASKDRATDELESVKGADGRESNEPNKPDNESNSNRDSQSQRALGNGGKDDTTKSTINDDVTRRKQLVFSSKNDEDCDRAATRDADYDLHRIKTKPLSSRDLDSDIEESPRGTSKSASRFSDFDENPAAFATESSYTAQQKQQQQPVERARGVTLSSGKRQINLANSSVQTCPSPRYNRDLLQSPTDTTDSDIEPISESNLRRIVNHPRASSQQATNKLKGVVRRREPTGLPPSPLPVAAAIQLHQLQQQHFRHQMTSGAASGIRNNISRANFLRSRSVTNSPNHMLERSSALGGGGSGGGYLTDNLHHRVRSTSPDTLSEFGGLRRRKRLPEPPSNAVPITPSMVRKMIQAQKAGVAASGKMLTSVNAQSTLLNNTHTNRSSALDRNGAINPHENLPPPSSTSLTHRGNSSSFVINESQPNHFGSYSSSNFNTRTSQQQGAAPTINSAQQNALQAKLAPGGASDLNKFLSSTYGNSILKNNISDVKETPELDKLIGNLDEFYNTDNKTRQIQPSQPSSHHLTQMNEPPLTYAGISSGIPPRSMGHPAYSASAASNIFDYQQNSSLASGTNSRLYQNASEVTPSYLMRRSSEGENSLTRSGARRPHRATNLDDSYRTNYGRNFTASAYIDGRNASASYLNSSPIRSSRYNTNSMTVSDRLRDYPMDTWTRDPLVGSSLSRYDRSLSTNQYYPSTPDRSVPIMNHNRLNSTRSVDCENLDYLSAHKTYPQMSMSDVQAPTASRYQSPYTNASTNIDLIRDKYRSSGINDRSNTINSSVPMYQSGLTSDTGLPPRKLSPGLLGQFQQKSFDLDSRRGNYYGQRGACETRARDLRQHPDAASNEDTGYLDSSMRYNLPHTNLSHDQQLRQTAQRYTDAHRANLGVSNCTPLTKTDIINNGPKFNSVGYRFRTENQNKYVAQARTPTQCLQSSYPHPYKRILLSKNPKDRIGNGIGIRVIGGQPIPNLYDKVNRCIVTSGAFVTEVFQNSNVHFTGEMREGDQIIEWNGVNLCNRSDEEVQEILLSQFSDDEVEIVYLPRKHLSLAYDELVDQNHSAANNLKCTNEFKGNGQPDIFDTFADLNKSGHQTLITPVTGGRYNSETPKGNIRRKISLSSIAQMWST